MRVEGQPRELLALVGGQRLHVVVKAGNRHAAILVAQFAQQLAQRHRRIIHRAAENAGMQIARRAVQRDLEAGNAAQSVGQRRMLRRRHARVGNDDGVAGQLRAVLAQEGRQALLPTSSSPSMTKVRSQGKLGAGFEIGFDRLEVGEVLAFVVARAAREERAVAHARLEGRRLPQLERLGRLHVVMAVNHEVRPPRALCLARAAFLATTIGCPCVGQSRASRPICRQCFTTHSAQARISLRCCGWAETLGKRT